MKKVRVTVSNQEGVHARPAAILVNVASRFESEIFLASSSDRVNAKSIMGVLSLGAHSGIELEIWAEGPDEEKAITSLRELFESKFDAKKWEKFL